MRGEVSEWLKVPLSKSGVARVTVGSNPTLSASVSSVTNHAAFAVGIHQWWAASFLWYSDHMDHIEQYTIPLGERGRLVLPAPLRRQLDLHPGDRLILTLDPGGGFRMVSAREQARRLCGLYRDLAPGRSLADELIAERHEEARRADIG